MTEHTFPEGHLALVSHLARESGKILLSRFNSPRTIEFKGAIDIVTDADRASEEFLAHELTSAFGDYSLITEESAGNSAASPYTWVVDPLDGTTNFAHHFPFFCVSIALAEEGRPILGVVFDPVRDELFHAILGHGAFLNGNPLSVSGTPSINESLLATGFPYDIRSGIETNLDHFSRFAVRAQAIRRAGSAALDLCYVAAGRFDGYWELKLKPWDMAAGSLIAQEAGGRVTDFNGLPYSIKTDRVVASNGLIHEVMIDIIGSGN